jgi:hypothetical protein
LKFLNSFKLAERFVGFNWYKWGIILTVFLAYTGGVAGWATHKASVHCEQEKTVAAEEKIRTIIKEVEVRVPDVQIREVESAKQKEQIRVLKEKLDAAIAKKPTNPACDLTSDERDGFNDLFKKTRSTK